MFVPTMVQEKVLDDAGFFSKPWMNLLEQLLQNMQQALSNEGFLIPSVTNSQMQTIQNGVDENGRKVAIPGTLLFNTETVNGGAPNPNGQLYILLKDGVFHPITNT